jgi:T4 superinfection immunity protein
VLGYEREVAMVLSTIFFFPFLFGFPLILYFLPSIIALARSKRDLLAIFLLNLFLGWSVIGWIVALVWAAKNDVPVVAR